MNSLSVAGKKNVKKRVYLYSCLHCKKNFSDQEVLRGHLRVHLWEIESRKNWNYSGCSSNSMDLTGTFLNPLTNSQPQNCSQSARKILPFFKWEASPLGFYKRHRSHERDLVNTSKFFGNNLANAKSHIIMPTNLSSTGYSAEIHHSTYLFAAAITPIRTGTTSSNVFAPADPSFCLGTSEVFHFNTDEFRTFRDGMPFISQNALQNLEYHDLSQKSVGQCNRSNAWTYEGNKRPYIGDVPGDAPVEIKSKRLKTSSPPPVQTEKPQKKELLLFKDAELTFYGLGVSSGAEEEVQVGLDLSLHL